MIKEEKSRYAMFTRRTLLVSGGMAAVFAVLAGRLYQLQIIDGERYLNEAEDNRVNERLLAPQRGRILDRFGVPLAASRRNYRVLIVPEQTPNGVAATLDALARVIPIANRAKLLKDAASNRAFVPLVVAENLSWDEFARLNLDLPYLQGVQPDVSETRDYPYAEEMSHVLGYVAPVSPEEKNAAATSPQHDPLLDIPGFRIGKRGIEKTFDQQIRGKAGSSRVEVNAYGRVIRELQREEGEPGEDVYLTLDRELQGMIFERLKTESAAAAVMDVQSGDVLALVSTPGYDPNRFNVGLSASEWSALTTDDHKPLINKTLSGMYPPGSTFKTVTALAALDAGAITPETVFLCSGAYSLGAHAFHCWKKEGHGSINLHQALKLSCDCYFYQVAAKLGIDQLEIAARKLGLGQPTGIEIPGERGGLIPSRRWKQATYKQPWQQGETLVAGIGQGYILTTPLQLCTLAARIASGREVSPRIVHCCGTTGWLRPQASALPFSAAALAAVRSGMIAAANEPGGTAYAWRIKDKDLAMAGKTGTAQVRVITKEERENGVKKNENLPWGLRDHALYIGFAPLESPRYACAVIIEHGAVAAHPQVQVARDALILAQQKDIAGRPTAYPAATVADAS